jgi:uncharacterized phage-associated protein
MPYVQCIFARHLGQAQHAKSQLRIDAESYYFLQTMQRKYGSYSAEHQNLVMISPEFHIKV